jgi:hypothetical protein
MSLVFEDMHDFPGNGDFYATPNESLELWDRLLQGLKLYKVAGICSGGEVGFFNLLPRVQRELVLLDHSYKALYFAAVKYLALQKYGPEETYNLLSSGRGTYQTLATEFETELPVVLNNAWKRPTLYSNHPRRGADAFESHSTSVARFWQHQKKDVLVKTCAKLHKVTFVHGDLTDLAAKGKFGLVYLSNALESNHLNRERKTSIPAKVAACIKPEGYVLTTHTASMYSNRVTYPENWELVSEAEYQDVPRGPWELEWKYQLRQVHPVAA